MNYTQDQLKKLNDSIINLKTDKEVFMQTVAGAKTFEIRFNDRNYSAGDLIMLKETKHTGEEMKDGAPLVYTGNQCLVSATYILSGYGLQDGWVIISTKNMGLFIDDGEGGLISCTP